MNTYIIVVSIAFAISFAAMLYYSKKFWPKIVTVTLLFIIANMVYFSLDSLKGWPSDDTRFKGQLIFVQVNEPHPGYKGAIYLYIVPSQINYTWYDHYLKYIYWDDAAPRSYHIPYSVKTGDKMNQLKQAIESGYIVEMDGIEGNDGDSDSQAKGNGERVEGNVGEEPVANDQVTFKIPRIKIIDPRTRSGKDTK